MNELPDYMTLRKNRINMKKSTQLNYTLNITNSLPRPDYRSVKSRLNDSMLPD